MGATPAGPGAGTKFSAFKKKMKTRIAKFPGSFWRKFFCKFQKPLRSKRLTCGRSRKRLQRKWETQTTKLVTLFVHIDDGCKKKMLTGRRGCGRRSQLSPSESDLCVVYALKSA
jgi:hypothetical protein